MPAPTEEEIKECMISQAGVSFAVAQAGDREDNKLSDLNVSQLETGLDRVRKWCRGLYIQTHLRGLTPEEITETFQGVRDAVNKEDMDIAAPLAEGAIDEVQEESQTTFLEDDDLEQDRVDTISAPNKIRRAIQKVASPQEFARVRQTIFEEGVDAVDLDTLGNEDDDLGEPGTETGATIENLGN
jgi:hypothetical protein